MQFNKLYLSIGLLLIGAIWVACVDIPSGPGTNVNPDFRSMVRFVHAAPSRTANSINIDGSAAGPSMSYLGNSGYLDVASGSRSLSFAGSSALTQAFGSEQQSTLVIYEVAPTPPSTTPGVAYLNLVEGDWKKNNAVAGIAKVKFVNVANGGASTVLFRRNAPRPASNTIATAAFGAAPQYLRLATDTAGGAGVNIIAVSSGGYITSDIKGANQVPPVTSGSTGSGTVDFIPSDSLILNATVKSMNSEGFYTVAHIHNGAAGVAGPVLYPIPVTTQTMTFRPIALAGTSGSGTGSLTVTNNTTATTGAAYSVTTTTPTGVGFFTSAGIRNGATSANLHSIAVSGQTFTFPITTASGTQEVPPITNSAARGTCTFTLYRDSLQFNVVLTKDPFDSVLTAAHFHLGATGANGPVVRTIISGASFPGDTTLSGTWMRTDTAQGMLTDALVEAIRTGGVYFNAHSISHAGGLVRGQLVPSVTHTNTFTGRFTGASFASVKDQFALSNMYFSFGSLTDSILGRAVPDTFTTNAYTATVTGVPDSIGALLNQGKIYFNFHTAANPSGAIRGQLGVDATKGEYAISPPVTVAFGSGRMYTLVATGRGSTFTILKLEDRVLGVNAKPAGILTPDLSKKVNAQKGQTQSE